MSERGCHTSKEPLSQNSSMSQVSGGWGASSSRGATLSSSPHRLSVECMLQIWFCVITDNEAFCSTLFVYDCCGTSVSVSLLTGMHSAAHCLYMTADHYCCNTSVSVSLLPEMQSEGTSGLNSTRLLQHMGFTSQLTRSILQHTNSARSMTVEYELVQRSCLKECLPYVSESCVQPHKQVAHKTLLALPM